MMIELNDITTELSDINNKLEADPEQLLKLNNRLDLLNNLLQKHRKQFIEELIDFKNEIEGKDYCFVDEKKFNNLIEKKSFYEYAKVFNNLYGTLIDPVIKNLSKGKDVLFDIDWQGSKQIKNQKLKLLQVIMLLFLILRLNHIYHQLKQ